MMLRPKVRKHLSAYHMQCSNLFESAVYGMQKMPEGLLTPTSSNQHFPKKEDHCLMMIRGN